jgi:energy-coupling factor transporter ATP-binding protein EcfA2
MSDSESDRLQERIRKTLSSLTATGGMMSLEGRIVDWSVSRPSWQRWVMRQVATGKLLSESDYDQLVNEILADNGQLDDSFNLGHLPQTTLASDAVRLFSVAKPKHVNALASDDPLTFDLNGITIIYGDNGSGKSGYARLLKSITRARHQEPVLSDVFRDSELAKPSAILGYAEGLTQFVITWPDDMPKALKRVVFYDSACGSAYIATESDFPFRPSGLFILDGLISACVAVRGRIDVRLEVNSATAKAIPKVDPDVSQTEAGRFLASLSGGSLLGPLDMLAKRIDKSPVSVDNLKDQEERLKGSDAAKEQLLLRRQAEKLRALAEYIEATWVVLRENSASKIELLRAEILSLEQAIAFDSQSFSSEPLLGVGTPSWKTLWESARRFSEGHAYPALLFPRTNAGDRCVLCCEVLQEGTRNRLQRFEEFVKSDAEVRLQQARSDCESRCKAIAELKIPGEAPEFLLADLESTHRELVAEGRASISRLAAIRDACIGGKDTRPTVATDFSFDAEGINSRLLGASRAATDSADSLQSPELARERLAAVIVQRKELELLTDIKRARDDIAAEILRLRERSVLESVKNLAATAAITNKILELSEESITEVVRDTFIRETDRLRLERVTISRTKAPRGTLLHQPKLVGTRQQVTLPKVFSEGERTALGLAAFFTEAHLDTSNSALVLDDPVTSLDHTRRGLVAARLASFAAGRQIIVFTHDVAFVADLKREARAVGIVVSERSVSRSRTNERNPGVCTQEHPWKTKDVSQRLDEIKADLKRIERDAAGWGDRAYDDAVATWAGNLSETWERIFSQEIVGQILAEGGTEVRPRMVKILAKFTERDHNEFDGSYSRVTQWLRRHDKSAAVNYVAPDISQLRAEVALVDDWFRRVRGYKN